MSGKCEKCSEYPVHCKCYEMEKQDPDIFMWFTRKQVSQILHVVDFYLYHYGLYLPGNHFVYDMQKRFYKSLDRENKA